MVRPTTGPSSFRFSLPRPVARSSAARWRSLSWSERLDEVPVQRLNTPRGTITVSTPEATALDLVDYQHHAGGLSQVTTVLAELAEKINDEKLAVAAAPRENVARDRTWKLYPNAEIEAELLP